MLPFAMPYSGSVAALSRAQAVMSSVRPIYKVVSDVRFAESVAFGRQAEHLGTAVVRINGDITDFWFNDLSIRWKESKVAIAGLTAHGPIFCLERLAWDHGMRVVFREDLAGPQGPALPGDVLVSWVIAPRFLGV